MWGTAAWMGKSKRGEGCVASVALVCVVHVLACRVCVGRLPWPSPGSAWRLARVTI